MKAATAILDRLIELFDRMDRTYAQTARDFGFECRGCGDNCCATEFYHHTLAEYLYLNEGLARLPQTRQQTIRQKAADSRRQIAAAHDPGRPVRAMCPLNTDGRCQLYPYRPMICRLHGIPHRLRRPDGRLQIGPGCADFEARCGKPQTSLLDRTPFYQTLARLENELRQRCGYTLKIKMTVAEIVTVDL